MLIDVFWAAALCLTLPWLVFGIKGFIEGEGWTDAMSFACVYLAIAALAFGFSKILRREMQRDDAEENWLTQPLWKPRAIAVWEVFFLVWADGLITLWLLRTVTGVESVCAKPRFAITAGLVFLGIFCILFAIDLATQKKKDDPQE